MAKAKGRTVKAKAKAKGFKNLDAAVGDFCAVRTLKSHTLESYETVERKIWDLGVVTWVTADGWVKAFKRADDRVVMAPGRCFTDLLVLPAGKLSHPVPEILEHVDAILDGIVLDATPGNVDRLNEFRRLLAPWRSDAESEADARRWPNGQGWDVDRHVVVRNSDGSLTARLQDLPAGVGERLATSDPIPDGYVIDLHFLRALIREAYCAPLKGQVEVAL